MVAQNHPAYSAAFIFFDYHEAGRHGMLAEIVMQARLHLVTNVDLMHCLNAPDDKMFTRSMRRQGQSFAASATDNICRASSTDNLD